MRRAFLPEGTSRYECYRRIRERVMAWWLGPPEVRPIPSPHVRGGSEPGLSVIVLSMHAPNELSAAVESLLTQRPTPEIVVVNSGRPGASQRLAHAEGRVKVIEVSNRLYPGAARNVGIAASGGKYVAFLASDCLAHPGWVARRVAAHRAGAAVVSSPVVPAAPNNPFAVASHLLLFPTRLPGTPNHLRRHYGCSYLRTLFDEHGKFLPDIRAGEDSEFNQRIRRAATLRYEPQVVTAHRNPTTPSAFLREMFARGHRSAQYYLDRNESITPAKVAKGAIERRAKMVRAAFAATPGRQWLPLLLAWPWTRLGAHVYAAGARSARPRSHSDDGRTPRELALVALLQLHNDRRYIADYLENVAPQVDGIIVLDDGSQDGGRELLSSHPKVLEVITIAPRTPHYWDEIGNRRLLVDASGRHRARWLVAIDADERVEVDFRVRVDALIRDGEARGIWAFQLKVRELWDAPDQYRGDGIWDRKTAARLFRWRPDHDFGDKPLHGHWAPLNSRLGKGFAPSDIVLYHQRMIHPEDRERRRQRYVRLDPNCSFQAIGYNYLVDPTGLQLMRLPQGRGYHPLRAPSPGDSQPPTEGWRGNQ